MNYTIDDDYSSLTFTSDTLSNAIKYARRWLSEGYDSTDGPVFSDGRLTWVDADGDEDALRVTAVIQQREPKCPSGSGHDFGTDDEFGGVRGHGGGVIVTEACAHCGQVRETDTWYQRPDTGEVVREDVITYPQID